jgi:hypothetical protein
VCLPLDDLSAWAEAIEELWTDGGRYRSLADAAVRHSRRPEVSTDHIASEFARILAALVEAPSEASGGVPS